MKSMKTMSGMDLRALRQARRLSLADLALASGVSAAWLGRLESYGASMTPRVAASLAPCLGVAAGTLREAHEDARQRRRADLTGRLAAGS